MRTKLCDLLSCEFPVVAFTHCRDVVAAVTNAGGYAVFGATSHTPESLEVELRWIDDHTGGKPYGIDILIPAKYEANRGRSDVEQQLPAAHVEFVDHLMEKYDVPPLPEGHALYKGLRAENAADKARELIDVAFRHPIGLFASALGTPPADVIERAHQKGAVVAALAGKPRHAEKHRDAGVDFVVAQGYEAGGHTGEITTMVLVPDVVDAVAPLPVVAAGGIASGRQMAAAVALGAAGVWTGSMWLATEEAETHPMVQKIMLRASSSDTLRSRCITGKTVRVLRSAWTDEWESPDTPDPLPMPLQSTLVSEARARIANSANTEGSGPSRLITNPCGQVVGRLNAVKPARQMLLEMVEEYADVVSQFAALAAAVV